MQHWTIKPVFNVIQMHICISTGKTGLNRLIYISGLSLNSLGFWDNGWSNNYHYSNRTHLGIIPITKSSSLFFYRHQKFISYIIYVALFHIQTTKFPIVGEMPPQELTPATTTAQVSSSISAVYRLTWGFFYFLSVLRGLNLNVLLATLAWVHTQVSWIPVKSYYKNNWDFPNMEQIKTRYYKRHLCG